METLVLMKHKDMILSFVTRMLTVAIATTFVACTSWSEVPTERPPASQPATHTEFGCSKTGVGAAIENLSHEDPVKAAEATKELLRYSEASPACKSEIISLLIRGMNKPDLNFVSDKASYSLTARYGWTPSPRAR